LILSGLRLPNVFHLPRTAHSGNDRGLHIFSSYRDSMRALFGSVHDFGCPIRQSHAYAEVHGQLANCRQTGSYPETGLWEVGKAADRRHRAYNALIGY
jgi:hypothetical protein